MNRHLYLGKNIETQDRIEFDPDHLVTHGVILGMTGSGKTGLAIGLLEEMVEAGVPVIAIDPKGDLPNLGLIFPEFKSSEFEKWTDPSEAQREGITSGELAQKKADLWKSGLEKSGLDGEHLKSVKNSMDLRVLTPGSKAIAPINLLGNFDPPCDDLAEDDKAELASGVITGLLSLVEDNIDPLRDPRHVLLVQILADSWQKKSSLSLEELIGQLVDPPFAKVGIFPVDSFFKPDDRMKLALQLNNLVASPTFAAWKEGPALDVASLMECKDGRTPVNLFYLAHLSEKERHFFVGRLMNEILTWTRSLSGSTSLRALVYFDEVAGYLPPHPHNPASKKPILTMLKQSRAVGVGVCLATQNPVDLDYKALSNMGTWMIGRLQTEQDRNRVRDGLISASGGLSAKEVEEEFSKIQPRTFLLKAPKADKPIVFSTRWAMSYLRGPITIAELGGILSSKLPEETSTVTSSANSGNSSDGKREGELNSPPSAPKGFGQSYLDPRQVFSNHYNGHFEEFAEETRQGNTVLCRPALHAILKLKFDERKEDFVRHERHHYLAFPIDRISSVGDAFKPINLEDRDILSSPDDYCVFTELPTAFDETSELKDAQDSLCDHLYRNLTSSRFINEEVKLYSRADEDREAFLVRCVAEAENLADAEAVKVRKKLESKIERVEKNMQRTKQKLARLAQSEKGKKLESLWGAGEMILSMFTKRRKSFSSVLSSSRRAMEANTRTDQTEEEMEKLKNEIIDLQDSLEQELSDLEAAYAEKAEKIEESQIRLDKSDIEVERFEILWIPVTKRV